MIRKPEHLGRIIEFMHPGATVDGRAAVAADFRGNIYLEHWDEEALGAQPTEAQLDEGWLGAMKQDKEAELKREAVKRLFETFPEAEHDSNLLSLEIAAASPQDARLRAARDIKEKLARGRERVRSAKKREDVDAIGLDN